MYSIIRIHTLFLAKAIPSWPKPDLDVEKEVERLREELDAVSAEILRSRGIRVEFSGNNIALTPEDVMSQKEKCRTTDGILFFNLTSGVGTLIDPVIDLADELELPMIFFAQPFSGHDWGSYARLRRFGIKVDLVASSAYSDIIPHLAVIHCLKRLRETRILVVTYGQGGEALGNHLRKRFGVTVEFVAYEELEARFQEISLIEATELARDWISRAERVVEPSETDIIASARLYLAIREIMTVKNAQAITINCLGGFAKGSLPAYPCLAFTILNDQGLFGVCEADLAATFTQIIGTYLTGRPGFVSDPVFDEATDELIHAHCVSATRMHGIVPESSDTPAPEVTAQPESYIIRTHMEDNKGVSLQVMMEPGQVVTCLKYVQPGKMLTSVGTITRNIDSDRGCRTKFATRVRDLRKILDNYSGDLHRVIFYGNLLKEMDLLEKYAAIQVIRED